MVWKATLASGTVPQELLNQATGLTVSTSVNEVDFREPIMPSACAALAQRILGKVLLPWWWWKA